MALQLVPIRCLADNFAWLLHGPAGTALIDAPEAGPILSELGARGWQLDLIVLTHHHDDHIQAVEDLVDMTGARVLGNVDDAARLPPLDLEVRPGETFQLCGEEARVIDVSGHTIGHIAIYLPQSTMVFTADSLMAIGCGRLFEGDAPMMWDSLSRLNALPPNTQVCSGHDYCRSNGAFALSVEPENTALKKRLEDVASGARPCAQASLAEERATNPFLRVAALRDSLDMQGQPDVQVFAKLRQMKDNFRG